MPRPDRHWARWLLLPALLVGGMGSPFAYRLATAHWQFAEATIFTGIPGTTSHGTFADALRLGLYRWNQVSPFKFVDDPGYRDPCAGYNNNLEGNGDLQNGVGFRGDVCGMPFADGAAAVTLRRTRTFSSGERFLLETDIIFNDAQFSWDINDDPWSEALDFRRVALHELGHALGLDH